MLLAREGVRNERSAFPPLAAAPELDIQVGPTPARSTTPGTPLARLRSNGRARLARRHRELQFAAKAASRLLVAHAAISPAHLLSALSARSSPPQPASAPPPIWCHVIRDTFFGGDFRGGYGLTFSPAARNSGGPFRCFARGGDPIGPPRCESGSASGATAQRTNPQAGRDDATLERAADGGVGAFDPLWGKSAIGSRPRFTAATRPRDVEIAPSPAGRRAHVAAPRLAPRAAAGSRPQLKFTARTPKPSVT